MGLEKHQGSFKDPSGNIFTKNNVVYRQINNVYKLHYDHLMKSGLYDSLVKNDLLVEHTEESKIAEFSNKPYKIIKPKKINFISYPYEWCFEQIKDAALTTLSVLKIALDHGMILKDASGYNIHFDNGKPIFIDTLSFEVYKNGEPWIAYKQFCQHFLAPLVLMRYTDLRLNQLLKIYIDGIPLDLTSKLLPFKTKLNFALLSHIHLHSKSQTHYANKAVDRRKLKMSEHSLWGIIDSLETSIKKLKLKKQSSEWANYYDNTNYSSNSFLIKKKIISQFLNDINPNSVWDLGANDGVFSYISGQKGIKTISFDIDPIAVGNNYHNCKTNKRANILPLILDLINPSPGIGWKNKERASLIERGPVDTVLALALIHHLSISNNLPFNMITDFFSEICHFLIIEFVPKDDSQVQKLLTTRDDIFVNYNQDAFEDEFKKKFKILNSTNIDNTQRTLYLMKKM